MKKILLSSIALLALWAPTRVHAESLEELTAKAKKAEKIDLDAFKKVAQSFIFVGGGSAVCISEDGYVLTNQHVVAEANVWRVNDIKGNTYVADVVGRDTAGDLVLMKIREGKNMAFAKLAPQGSIIIGQKAIAVGDPFKLGMGDFIPSISQGIVSGEHLFNFGNYSYTYSDAVQTDAAVNPGNSGGPLFNAKGEIIGINGQIRSNGVRANRGIGLAISSDRIHRFLPALKEAKGGIVMHGYIMGISFTPNKDKKVKGIKLNEVHDNTLAARKGLKTGDIIKKVGSKPSQSTSQFMNLMMSQLPNTLVELTILRDNKEIKLKYKLDAISAPPFNFGPRTRPIGLPRTAADKIRLRTGFVLNDNQLTINNIEDGSPAQAAGLKIGDEIISVNDQNSDIVEYIKAATFHTRTTYPKRAPFMNVTVKRKIDNSDLTYSFTTTLQLDFLYNEIKKSKTTASVKDAKKIN